VSEYETAMVAVGFIVREGKIFVAKRAKTKKNFPGRYELVGGHIDRGESPEQTIIREIKEEIGIEVEVGQIVGAFTFEVGGEFEIEVAYLCYPLTDAEPVLDPNDHSEAMWIGESEVYKMEKDDEETDMLKQAFKMIKGDIK